MIVEISIVKRQSITFQDNKEKCPRCHYVNLSITATNGWIEWQVLLNIYVGFKLTLSIAVASARDSSKLQRLTKLRWLMKMTSWRGKWWHWELNSGIWYQGRSRGSRLWRTIGQKMMSTTKRVIKITMKKLLRLPRVSLLFWLVTRMMLMNNSQKATRDKGPTVEI